MARGGVLRDVAEWQSPNFRELGGQLFGAFLVCTLVILARKRVGARDLLITVIFMLLGLWAIRNVGLAVIAIAPILARLVRNDSPRADARHSMHRTMLAMAVLALSLCVVHAAGEPDWNLDRYPVAAFDAVQAQHLEGRRLLTTDAWGGYLIAVALPQQKVFFDDRYDMYPLAINQDYDTLARVKPDWLETLDRHHIDVVMWRSESALVQALAQRPDWVRIHTDAVATVYARRSVLTSSSA
jgi:hypothetical protein